MNWMQKLGTSIYKTGFVFGSMWRPTKDKSGTYFYPTNFNSWGDINYLQSFFEIPELNAIINLVASCFSNGQIKLVNDKGEELEHPIVSLLENPNWFQAGHEFKQQTKVFHEIFGNEYIYNLFPLGFKPNSELAGTKAMYTLPPNLVEPQYMESVPFYTFGTEKPKVDYVINGGGVQSRLAAETILHFNDNRVCMTNTSDKNMLKGESKLKALTAAINNIKAAYESRGVILKNRGALGILSNSGINEGVAIPLKEDDITDIQEKYSRYGGLANQHQLIITNAALKWQQMSVNPDKLGLYQETQECFDRFCDAFGTPAEMFVRTKGATYENQKEARKGMYQNKIIPDACQWIGGFNKMYFPEKKMPKLVMTYHHLPVFQEDLKLRGEALDKMVNSLSKMLADGAITIDEYKAELQKFGIGPKK